MDDRRTLEEKESEIKKNRSLITATVGGKRTIAVKPFRKKMHKELKRTERTIEIDGKNLLRFALSQANTVPSVNRTVKTKKTLDQR
jgi:hypothetical protein